MEVEGTMSGPTSKVAEVRVPGPLAPFAAAFKSTLLDMGYTPLSAVIQLRLMVHLSRWLQARGLSAVDLTDERAEEYIADRRAAGYRGLVTRRALAPLLDLLTSVGARSDAALVEPVRLPPLLASFERYLRVERGLAPCTVEAYVARATRFVVDFTVDGDVSTVTAADVTGAVLAEYAAKSVGAGQYYVAALRSLLRFCRMEGLVSADLSAAALAVTGRRSSLLPKGISAEDGRALLRSCDRRRVVGRRDYAVLLILLRLGLRAGEVARLRLEDIDWRAGQIVVRGKGRRDERMPLPADVGAAIAAYLRRGRPAVAVREVFVSAIAPWSALARGSVSLIVRRACRRAGITAMGAHRLRHGLACAMVRAQVPLAQIGQVLRHRSPITTAGYARVDVDQLRTLARPWPGQVSSR
jgi:integrase/recombinase XerD